MSLLCGKPSAALLAEKVDRGAPSMTACSAGSGSKRTLPFALGFQGSRDIQEIVREYQEDYPDPSVARHG